MKKTIILFLLFVLLPININAANSNSKVGYDLGKYECTSAYQDSNISTSKDAYFSYCMRAVCTRGNNGYNYVVDYYSNEYENEKVNCLNGNKNPYYILEDSKNGCKQYTTCNSDEVGNPKYCSIIMYYDCGRKADGSAFATTTKKRPTTKKQTTTTTTTVIPYSTKLKNMTLSKGDISFNSNVYDYNITLEVTDSFVEVYTELEDSRSTVEIKNNYDLVDGSVIEVIVTAPDSNSTTYKINVSKNRILSSNANLAKLSVEGYELNFNKDIKEYNLTIKDETNLNIDYETEDSNALVNIENNENLTDKSRITINVIAEDGTVNSYYIDIAVKSNINILTIIFVIILILAILAGAYYLYIKFIANKGGEKYEYE